ncbi:MAG: hypothetical protein WEC80_01065 [Patescibacteria group bacterium]
MKKRQEKQIKNNLKKVTLTLILLGFFVFFIVQTYNSLIYKRPDRINVFILDERPTLLSISTSGESNYILNFYSDLKINVPGGFGFYRVGALNKLVDLEKDPDLYKRALTGTILTFTEYYFYPRSVDIDYGKKEDISIVEPRIRNILFSKSNANFLDRLYLAYKVLTLKKNSIRFLDTPEKINISKDLVFDSERFEEKYNGLFFHSTYRKERKSVQVLYTKEYTSADIVAQTLENSGIRVVDISKSSMTDNNCEIIETQKPFSETAKDISNFFSCKLVLGESEISDIIVNLGDIERKWSNSKN